MLPLPGFFYYRDSDRTISGMIGMYVSFLGFPYGQQVLVVARWGGGGGGGSQGVCTNKV